MSINEFFVTGFYRNPTPEVAVAAINELIAAGKTRHNISYGLGRACAHYPKVNAAVEGMLPGLEGEARVFVESLCPPVPVSRGFTYITSASDLDDLWADFLATGDEQPVRWVVNVLDQPDKIGSALAAWKLSLAYKPEAEQAFGQIGLPIDYDVYCARVAVAKKIPLATIPFPMELTREMMASAAIKGAAFWASHSMAQQHEIVLRVCMAGEGTEISYGRKMLIDALTSTRRLN